MLTCSFARFQSFHCGAAFRGRFSPAAPQRALVLPGFSPAGVRDGVNYCWSKDGFRLLLASRRVVELWVHARSGRRSPTASVASTATPATASPPRPALPNARIVPRSGLELCQNAYVTSASVGIVIWIQGSLLRRCINFPSRDCRIQVADCGGWYVVAYHPPSFRQSSWVILGSSPVAAAFAAGRAVG